MIIKKSKKDLQRMLESGAVLAEVHDELAKHVEAGISTLELDAIAERMIRAAGGTPTFKGYRGFPGSLCTSNNDMVVHGIPSADVVLANGDLISIDAGVTLHGWVSDSARSYVVGAPIGGDAPRGSGQHLIDTAYASLEAAIDQCQVGNWMGDVSHAIQGVVEAEGYGVIRQLVGHGVGRNMHEDPQVSNFGSAGTPPRLEAGFVLAIEPMITVGSYDIVEDENDGWSIYTADGSLAAHVEHTVAITEDGPLVLTRSAGAVVGVTR